MIRLGRIAYANMAPVFFRVDADYEEIFRAAGSTTGTEQKLEELVRVVRAAGRTPVQRDTLYNELRRWDA